VVRKWLLIALLGVVALAETYAAERYIKDVLSGKQAVCKYTRLAVERHLRDLKRQNTRDFPFYFDAEQAKRVIDFKQQLKLVEGEFAGARIKLEPWLQFKDWVLFGWRRREGGYRRFTKSYISVGRKNTKTTDAAGTALYVLFAELPRERGPQIYCVGPQKKQGKLAWKIAAEMVKAHPALARRARFFKENTNEPVMTLTTDGMAVMTVWGRDAATQDGFSASMAVVDEAHLYPGQEAMEVIQSGQGNRPHPLLYIITSAGFDKESPCYIEEHSLAVEILEQTADPVPENFFALIYTLDEGDDFKDQSVWIKANPNLGITPRLDYLKDRITEALSAPTKRNGVLTKNFNIWTHVETRWIAPEAWTACAGHVNEEELEGQLCYGGIDLSMTRDIAAWVLCFLPTEERSNLYKFLYRFFLPKENIEEREREDRRQYRYWAEKGLLTLTPGPQVDYGIISQVMQEDAKRFKLSQFGYDPYRAGWLISELEKDGSSLEAVMYRQTYEGMAVATALFERAIIGKTIAHGGNPIMKWMVACTEVKSDRQGLTMPMKPRRGARGKRIDGVVASIIAHDRAVRNQGKAGSVYDERGVLAV
jgi:phage terminase large subunit-like protein